MRDELADLFGRSVDLLTRRAVERSPNYLRRKEILGSARVIYRSQAALDELDDRLDAEYGSLGA